MLSSRALQQYKFPEIPKEEEEFIVRSPYSDVDIPEISLTDYVFKDVEKWPERTALVSKCEVGKSFIMQKKKVLQVLFIDFFAR